MTNEEMKMAFAKSGVAEADIEKISEKYDAEKITELVETAHPQHFLPNQKHRA